MTSKFISRRDIDNALQAQFFLCLESTDDSCVEFIGMCDDIENKNLVRQARDRRIGYEGRTLLHNAARLGKLNAVRYLLSIQHPVDPVDSSVSLLTPIMDAVAFHFSEIAITLATAGANLAHQDIQGENVLHYTARSGSARLIVDIIRASGLSTAAIQATVSACNVKLKFPEDVAMNSHCREVLKEYRESGTKVAYVRAKKSIKSNKASQKVYA